MLTIKNAKLLLALSVVAAPWDYFQFGRTFGWGVAFAWGWFVQSPATGTDQFRTIWHLFELRAQFSPVLPLYIWIVAGVVAIGAALYVAAARLTRGTTTRVEDRRLGATFVGAGLLYVGSRFLIYDALLVGDPGDVYYYSVPLGALWVVFVGVVFYRDLFRVGTG